MSRIDRINESVKREVSDIVQKEVKDPRLKFVTIMQAEVSRDLQHAKIYFSVFGDNSKIDSAQQGLDSAKGFIRKLVGQRVRMRYTPDIDFIFDESVSYGAHIEEIIEKIKHES
ncbi:MAG: 30S ribosome-binding factor RbfA [Candidatus Omnitrophota bacterium]